MGEPLLAEMESLLERVGLSGPIVLLHSEFTDTNLLTNKTAERWWLSARPTLSPPCSACRTTT